jgi:hypothetical protein
MRGLEYLIPSLLQSLWNELRELATARAGEFPVGRIVSARARFQVRRLRTKSESAGLLCDALGFDRCTTE